MSKKQPDHHELPRLYLRGFCENNTSFIWVFQRGKSFFPGSKRGKNNPLRSGLRKTGLRKDKYAVLSPGHKPDYSYEIRLQREELKADFSIKKIRNREALDISDKKIIARYIGMMKKRLMKRDHTVAPQLNEQINQYPWEALYLNLAFEGRFGAALQVPRVKEYLSSEHGKTKLLRESMLQPFYQAHKALMSMNWSFLVAPAGEYFITSDNPVVYDEKVGLLGSWLLFPISQHIVLLAEWTQGKDLSHIDLTADKVRKLNSHIVITATNEIYSPKPDEWIHRGWENGFVWQN